PETPASPGAGHDEKDNAVAAIVPGCPLIRVVEQYAIRGTFHVVVLAGAERPQEYRQTTDADDQARTNQIENDAHDRPPRSRKLLDITNSEELDIATAASQGVTKPQTAS